MSAYTGSLPPWGLAEASFPGDRSRWAGAWRDERQAIADTRTGGYQPFGMARGAVSTPQDRVKVTAARKQNAAINSRAVVNGRAIKLGGI